MKQIEREQMKKLKDLKTGDCLYFYRDSDYSLEDVEKCILEVFSNETITFLSFGWGIINFNTELIANDTKVIIHLDKPYHFYVSPPPKSHYKKNIKRRMKELELEITKLKFAKLALGMTK